MKEKELSPLMYTYSEAIYLTHNYPYGGTEKHNVSFEDCLDKQLGEGE